MANQVKQFRYYEDNNENNQPSNCDSTGFVSGDVFGSCFPVSQLGVQALPGTRLKLNNATEYILIGATGIFELDLNNQTEITKIQFDEASMNLIEEKSNAVLIVDLIYDDGEE